MITFLENVVLVTNQKSVEIIHVMINHGRD